MKLRDSECGLMKEEITKLKGELEGKILIEISVMF